MDTNTVSPMPEMAPMAEFDKSSPSPKGMSPGSKHKHEELPPPPSSALSDHHEVSTIKSQKKFETEDNDWGCINWCEYMIVITLTSLLLISTVSLVLFWALYYREGFAWRDNPQKEFNLHPVLMVTGFIFFSGFSLLLYRICRCCRRLYVKLGHAILHSLAIPCIVLGFLAVWDSKNLSQPKGTNFYSLHSWLGLVTIGLFLVQFLVGFFSFLILICCQGKTKSCRAGLVPIHSSFGITIYMLAVATCLTGFAEKAIYTLGPRLPGLPQEGVVINTIGMVLIALVTAMAYALKPKKTQVKIAAVHSVHSGV